MMDEKPRTVDLLLTDVSWLLPCTPRMPVIRGGAVAIHAGVIQAVGEKADVESRYESENTIRLTDHILLPGLVNTHVHAAMSLFRGLGDDLPLQQWLEKVIFPAESRHVDPWFVHLGTLLACVEMLQGGITTFCDGYFFEEEAARAVEASGIRAVLGQGVLDFPTPDVEDPSRFQDRVEAFLSALEHFPERIRPSLFCHAPYTCSAETLQRVKKRCTESRLLFQIHLSETRSEVEQLLAEVGERPAFYLDRLGILDERTLCAHAVWLNAEERELLAERRAAVAHNVESNLKLASGIAPIPDLLQLGVRVGLGTDGCASNNDLNLFSEMSLTAKVHKAVRKDPTVCSAGEVLRMATALGAEAVGWGDEVGTLEEGKRADCIAVRLDRPHLTPLFDPVSHLVYAAGPGDVDWVWVDGKTVVRHGEVQTVDVPELLKEVRTAAASIGSRFPGSGRRRGPNG